MMRLVQQLARKSFQCLGLLKSKFIVITLKQNRPHNIINVRYSSRGLSRERFNDNPSFYALLYILPPNDPTNIYDIESLHSLDNLVNKVKLWRSSFTPQVNQESFPQLFLNALAYPSVRNVIQIILALPATTVEAERSFSCMRRVKT